MFFYYWGERLRCNTGALKHLLCTNHVLWNIYCNYVFMIKQIYTLINITGENWWAQSMHLCQIPWISWKKSWLLKKIESYCKYSKNNAEMLFILDLKMFQANALPWFWVFKTAIWHPCCRPLFLLSVMCENVHISVEGIINKCTNIKVNI